MHRFLQREITFLRRPLNLTSRILLLFAAVALVVSVFAPLWQIRLVAPQYQDGLELNIYSYQIEAGNNGQDLVEINLLNHYIGMKPIDEADFVEMKWVPFALGFFVIFTLRAMVFGRMSNLVDLFTLFIYFGIFSMGSFYYRLHTYGHELDPTSPMTIEPFTPVIFGKNQIANFTQWSYPAWGSYMMVAFAILVLLAGWISRKEEPPE